VEENIKKYPVSFNLQDFFVVSSYSKKGGVFSAKKQAQEWSFLLAE
jgi:hypothetical protein